MSGLVGAAAGALVAALALWTWDTGPSEPPPAKPDAAWGPPDVAYIYVDDPAIQPATQPAEIWQDIPQRAILQDTSLTFYRDNLAPEDSARLFAISNSRPIVVELDTEIQYHYRLRAEPGISLSIYANDKELNMYTLVCSRAAPATRPAKDK